VRASRSSGPRGAFWPAGKRRLHEKPNRSEITACRLWLDAEIRILGPQVVVCLGATAAQALISPTFEVTKQRGNLVPSPPAPHVLATVHPSSIVRAPDDAARDRDRSSSSRTSGW
jgi:DNA polymerase